MLKKKTKKKQVSAAVLFSFPGTSQFSKWLQKATASYCGIFLCCSFNAEFITEFYTKNTALMKSTLHALLGFVVLNEDSIDRIS